MIDYETFCKIKHYRKEEHLTLAQTARALDLHPLTVAKWATREQYRARRSASHASQLDPFKPDIVRWLEAHPLSAAQILQRLKEAGYPGGYTIVKDYVSRVRPRRAPAFLTLAFAPGEAAQVDWGEYGDRTRHDSAASELFRDGALLQPAHVPYVHRLADHGAFSCLSPARLRSISGDTLEDHGR